MPQRSVRPYLWMLAGSASFAVMAALAHAAAERCSWQTVAVARAFLVLLFVGTYTVATGTRLVIFRPRRLWVRSLAGSLSLVMTFYALSRLPASTVVTLTNTFPVWVAVLSWPVLGALPSGRVWLAVVGGVAGVYLIQMPHGAGDDFAIALALLAAAATSVAMIGLHKLRGVNPNAVVVHFSAVATLASLAAFVFFDRRTDGLPVYHPEALALLVGIGLTASLGQMLLTRAFAHGEPARVSVVGLSQVVFSLVIDVALVGYSITNTALFGTLLILTPTAWVMLERRRKTTKYTKHTKEPELAAAVDPVR